MALIHWCDYTGHYRALYVRLGVIATRCNRWFIHEKGAIDGPYWNWMLRLEQQLIQLGRRILTH